VPSPLAIVLTPVREYVWSIVPSKFVSSSTRIVSAFGKLTRSRAELNVACNAAKLVPLPVHGPQPVALVR